MGLADQPDQPRIAGDRARLPETPVVVGTIERQSMLIAKPVSPMRIAGEVCAIFALRC